MNGAAALTRLYPPAIRERWGPELRREVSAAGIRCWPDTVAGAARLWLRPSEWPETAPAQTRRVLTTALFGIAAVTALLLRAGQPSSVPDVRHPTAGLWLTLILLGTLLAAPVPQPRWDAARRLAVEAIRALSAPACAIALLALVARSGAVENPAGPSRAALITWYWATLGFTALRPCGLIARTSMAATMPSTRRLRTAFLLTGAGTAAAAAQDAAAGLGGAPRAGCLGLTFGMLAAAALCAAHDLRGLPDQSAD